MSRDQPPMTTGHPPVSLLDQVACVQRELEQRRRVYERLVESGKTPNKARWEIRVMAAVLETVQAAAAKGRLL